MKITNEAKIGIVAIISFALFFIGVKYLKGINVFKPSNYYYVSCTNAYDISISGPVYLDGFKVGLIRDINYNYDEGQIKIEITLDKGVKINKGSYVSIESTLLSGTELHIILNKYVTEYYKSGELLEGRLKGGMMSTVQNDIMPQFAALMPKIDSILVGLNALVNNPALSQSLANLEKTSAQLETSSMRLTTLLDKDVPQIASSLKTTSSNLADFSSGLNELDIKQSISSLNSALADINTLTQRLNSENGSLGLLLNDKQLYNNLNSTMENASDLLIDLKQHPKRYVHFSLFGRKEKTTDSIR